MKGRRLPLGGTARTRRSASDADESYPLSADDSPTLTTRQRESPMSMEGSPPDKSAGVASKESKQATNKTDCETPPKTLTSTESDGTPMQVEFITTPSTSKSNPVSDPDKKRSGTPQRLKTSSKTASDDGPRRTPSRRRSTDTNATRTESSSAQDIHEDTGSRNGKGKQTYAHRASIVAYDADLGSTVGVKLIVEGSQYIPPPEKANSTGIPLGHDGNLYFCFVCNGFGDVVCCDGCPRVYHKDCIPTEDPARKSLEEDADPWHCPECLKKKSHGSAADSRAGSRLPRVDRRSTSQHRCVDCQQDIEGLMIRPCSECGNYAHHPSCTEDINSISGDTVLCATCRAVENLTREEDEMHEVAESTLRGGRRNDDGPDDDNDSGDWDSKSRRKRSRADSVSTENQTEEKRKKKKKKRKKVEQGEETNSKRNASENDIESEALVQKQPFGPVQAIPGFYFYLAENRWKIERILARKHRYFNRLPKGSERNELVAKEAALWWVKLRPTDHRRYMTMSMRDFESRIIEWKEGKNLSDEMLDEPTYEEDVPDPGSMEEDISVEDEKRANERHEQRFHSTSVGSKPFRPEPGHSYNRVLLDLLHDMRFHPCPLVDVNRLETPGTSDEQTSKATIPFFEVHGPISTSIGDECLGCSRGWRHFCTVLRRQMPSIEHRAKLQPPLSSLMATRVGLGLRPLLENEESDSESDIPEKNKQKALHSWQKTAEARELERLPVIPSSTLGDASSRVDDIVLVIEETTAMRVPEPPRPLEPEKGQSNRVAAVRSLPLQRSKDDTGESGEDEDVTGLHRCGRCRTVSESEMGCIQCRRAQLVINMTKKSQHSTDGSSKTDGKSLKVQTVMLGRVQMKEGSGDNPPTRGDLAVSNAILKQRWAPMAVLAPDDSNAPPRKNRRFFYVGSQVGVVDQDKKEEEDDDDEDSLVEMENGALPEAEEQEHQPATDKSSDRSRVRQRPARLLVSSASTKDYNGDHSKQLERQRRAEEISAKCVTIACYGIFLAMLRRDPQKVFARPVADEDILESKMPIDFSIIRENLLTNQYVTIDDLVADFCLLCDNALAFYPVQSVHWKTAKDMRDSIEACETRANEWVSTLNDAYGNCLQREIARERDASHQSENGIDYDDYAMEDPFAELRDTWPEAVQMLENGQSIRNQVEADFMRTKENEVAYYGTLAIRRAAAAAAISLAPYTDSGGEYGVTVKRDHIDDQRLRDLVDDKVAQLNHPVQLSEVSSWREESVVRILRAVQSRRMERRSIPENGCSRCIDFKCMNNKILDDEMFNPEKRKKRGEDGKPRLHFSRSILSTGLGSAKTCQGIVKRQEGAEDASHACISVGASKIHGMGVFADQPFKKGDIVAEYVGEYIDDKEVERREKKYREQRRQEFMFRISDKLAIDATVKGGAARFINHNCEPNCYSSIVPGDAPNEALQRVMIISLRNIDIKEEITYDYRIPLEADLNARIPCNCLAEDCRGFMNWDLPETGSNNRALLVHKRGANMRDRIRRLRRPLKRD